MAAELTSSEITELAAWHILEPDVGRRIDEGFARVLELIWNVTQKKKKAADEFMPKRGPIDKSLVAKKWSAQWDLMQQIERMKRKRNNG